MRGVYYTPNRLLDCNGVLCYLFVPWSGLRFQSLTRQTQLVWLFLESKIVSAFGRLCNVSASTMLVQAFFLVLILFWSHFERSIPLLDFLLLLVPTYLLHVRCIFDCSVLSSEVRGWYSPSDVNSCVGVPGIGVLSSPSDDYFSSFRLAISTVASLVALWFFTLDVTTVMMLSSRCCRGGCGSIYVAQNLIISTHGLLVVFTLLDAAPT